MSDETPQNKWKDRELGALWRRQGKNQTFLSGKVKIGEDGKEREIALVVFKNNYKETDRQPDFIVYEDQPREQIPATAPETDDILEGEGSEVPSGF
jgi:hypothetical protein